MSGQRAPRYQGKITSWKDDQGFGFITPNGGGPAVFVHIKAFAGRGNRPAAKDIVTYHLDANEKGQPRAENVAFVRGRAFRAEGSRRGSGWVFTAAGFLAFVAACVFVGKLPLPILGIYLCMSAVAFIAYAVDKSAARKQRWRTSEASLLMLGLAGGWPGALVAQQTLRHKSKKQRFLAAYWLTVLANCAGLGYLLSASGSGLLRSIAGAP